MEDGYGVITNIRGDPKQAFFGVFDGHGGRAAVDYVSKNLGKNIVAALEDLEQKGNGDPETAIVRGYLATDEGFLSQAVGSGACAATVLLKDGELHVANAGDCRVVVTRNGVATELTTDHRPEREDERTRIENSGGLVSCHNGVWRVQGSLAISRAIGDIHLKDWIISKPETTKLELTSDCEFLMIASDGLWEKVFAGENLIYRRFPENPNQRFDGRQVSIEEAAEIVAEHRSSVQSCRRLVDMSSGRGCRDDITVMVVDLRRFVRGRKTTQ
ncbi:unnamed protein product [Spirodela intermedia]|uniref:protein-serine/threonine phosphatase n=1 Tax=Spirodela intermedia TaxID=51605 RepID=A0A7I8J3J6_SPIIN|nr:unnamed protein product [Spirodela intermedia]CAA6663920.1 unnamed protein product [Spirodela intermedia]